MSASVDVQEANSEEMTTESWVNKFLTWFDLAD